MIINDAFQLHVRAECLSTVNVIPLWWGLKECFCLRASDSVATEGLARPRPACRARERGIDYERTYDDGSRRDRLVRAPPCLTARPQSVVLLLLVFIPVITGDGGKPRL